MISSENSEERKLSCRLILDTIFLLIVAIPVPFFYIGTFTPFRRGYFCDDETIRYPYKDSTVTDAMLYIVGLTVGILSIIVSELVEKFYADSDTLSDSYTSRKHVPSTFLSIFTNTVVFLFGVCLTEVATNFIKYTLGRLRPNFLDVCQSDFDCKSVEDPHLLVLNYTCTNPDTFSVDDSRLSFPSGHSSIAAYTILFSVIYLQKHMICPYTRLFKPVIQYVLILLAVYTAVSRLGDNKHHWSDIISGLLLGIIVASSMFFVLPNNCERRVQNTSKVNDTDKDMELG